ncbi:hypothetical protein MTO96_006505 [Rhipicephalus appendiculatus]
MNAAPGRDEALSENRGQPPAPDSNRRRPQQPAAGNPTRPFPCFFFLFCEPAIGCATKHRRRPNDVCASLDHGNFADHRRESQHTVDKTPNKSVRPTLLVSPVTYRNCQHAALKRR